jgi:P27 family predicted phage terminase small subunit
MKGRKPKPAAQQVAEGDPRRIGVHKLEQRAASEAKATRGLPNCPTHLKGLARKAWKFWSRELEAMGMDCRPDGPMLEGVCIAYANAIEAYETIQKQSTLVAKRALDPETNKLVVVNVKPHPAVAQGNAAWALVKAFCSEFGFSPVSRSRLALEKGVADEEDLLAILSRPRQPRSDQLPESTEVIQ